MPAWRPAAGQILDSLEPQYYGGVRESADATVIHVRGGDSLADIDFHLASEPSVKIHGQISGVPEATDAPETQPGSPLRIPVGNRIEVVQVRIASADPVRQSVPYRASAESPDYRFQFPAMLAGRYRVEADYRAGGKAYGASQVFDVQPGADDILLNLQPAVDITGTLRVEGAPERGNGKGFGIRLTRPGQPPNPQDTVSAQVSADGRFSLPQVLPGDWRLEVTPVPPGFLKVAQFGDKDVRFTSFELPPSNETTQPAKKLNIVVSMNTATVEGEVDAGPLVPNLAGIVLAPVGPYHNLTRFYYAAAADQNGKFKLSGIAPGKYKLFALEKMEAEEFRNPEAIDQLDEFGEVIDVAEGATVEAHPKLIPMDRAAKALE